MCGAASLVPVLVTRLPHVRLCGEFTGQPRVRCGILDVEGRCDERLKTKDEESTRLTYTGLLGELEHLMIKTRLIDEMFASLMREYVFLK
jgi:hypothetical protein